MNGNTSQTLIEVLPIQGVWITDVAPSQTSQAASGLWFENDTFFETDAVTSSRTTSIQQISSFSGHRASFLSNIEVQMSQHEATVQQEISDLRRWYVMSNADELGQFLQQHRALPSLLLEIREPLVEAFGDDARLDLSLAVTGEDSPIVRVAVSWPGTLYDAEAALEHFDNHFWLANYARSSGHILVSFDLI